MKLTDDTIEAEFEVRIDARFPYGDPVRSTALIEEARSISLNAVFCVLDEICRPPKSELVTPERQKELVAEWSARLDHELKMPLLTCAAALMDHQPLDWRKAVEIMDRIGQFDGQRGALSVAYFAGDCESQEGDSALEAAYKRITKTWDDRAV